MRIICVYLITYKGSITTCQPFNTHAVSISQAYCGPYDYVPQVDMYWICRLQECVHIATHHYLIRIHVSCANASAVHITTGHCLMCAPFTGPKESVRRR